MKFKAGTLVEPRGVQIVVWSLPGYLTDEHVPTSSDPELCCVLSARATDSINEVLLLTCDGEVGWVVELGQQAIGP